MTDLRAGEHGCPISPTAAIRAEDERAARTEAVLARMREEIDRWRGKWEQSERDNANLRLKARGQPHG